MSSTVLKNKIIVSPLLLLLIILFAALAIRAVYHIEHTASPDYASPVLDPQLNDYWARALLSGDWTPPRHADNPEIRENPYGRPPGYPWLLALMYRLSKGSYHGPRIIQLFVGLLLVALLYRLGAQVFNKKTGLICAALMAVFWGAPYFEGELNSPVWECLLLVALFLLFLSYLESHKKSILFLTGLICGIALLVRPNLLMVLFFLCVYFLLHSLFKKERLRAVAGKGLLLLFAVALPVAPVLVRNWRVSGELIFISYYGGVNAYIGNNPEADAVSPTIPNLYTMAGVEDWNCFNYPALVKGLGKRLGQEEMTFAEASSWFYKKALQFWLEEPIQAMTLSVKKAWYFWGPHEISDSKVVHFEKKNSPLLRILPGFTLIAALALSGLLFFVFSRQRLNDKTGLLLLFIMSYFLSIQPFFMSERYRFPIVPFLLPFAAYALTHLVSALVRGETKQALLRISLIVAAGVLMGIEVYPYHPNESTWYLHRAFAATGRQDFSKALSLYKQAWTIDPDNAEAFLQAGYIHAAQGSHEQALECYLQGLEKAPRNRYLLNNTGYEYYLQKEYARARDYFEEALRLWPDYLLPYHNLGNTLMAMEKWDEALQVFQSLLHLSSGDAMACYQSGNVLLEQKAYPEAMKAFEKAQHLDPDNPDVVNNLGLAYLHAGSLDKAIVCFEKALALRDPYPLAHLNLGRVYEQQGRVAEALSHFEICLQFWPENKEAMEGLSRLLSQDQADLPRD
jgi:tetratricopeptide (TPR) repeat protein